MRVNQKIMPLNVEKFFELRQQHNLSAMKRFAERGVHNDMRAHNGQKTKRKITPEIER